jgi:hypothetical protein
MSASLETSWIVFSLRKIVLAQIKVADVAEIDPRFLAHIIGILHGPEPIKVLLLTGSEFGVNRVGSLTSPGESRIGKRSKIALRRETKMKVVVSLSSQP